MIKRTLVLVCALPAMLWAQASAGIQKGEVLKAPRAATPSTELLFPFVSTQNGYDTEITISNTSEDTQGSNPLSGNCSLRLMGGEALLQQRRPFNIAAGHSAVVDVSAIAPNFQGYVSASCSFPMARGGARVFSDRSSFWQDAQVVDGAHEGDSLLFPYISNRNSDDTLLAIANPSAAAGVCDLNFSGSNAPARVTTASIAAGSVYSTRASLIAPGFQGYAVAICGFSGVAGTAAVDSLFGMHPTIAAEPEALTGSGSDAADPMLLAGVSNRNGLDTNLVILNTQSQTGACTLNFQGVNAPAPFRTAVIETGSLFTAPTSALAPGFEGFVVAQCDFPRPHGVASMAAAPISVESAGSTRSTLLFPAVNSWNGADTSFRIANTGSLAATEGACRISYFGDMADGGYTPAPQTSIAIRAGEQLTFSLSQGNPASGIAGIPAFRGYAIADCDFPRARGTASFTSPLKTTAMAAPTSLPVVSAGKPIAERAGTATPRTSAPPSSYIASSLTGGLPVATAADPATFPLGTFALSNNNTNGTTAVTIDVFGNIYFAIGQNNEASAVYRVDPNGVMTRVAGTGYIGFSGDGGPAINATMSHPAGLAIDASGNLYISDQNNERIRMVNTSGIITTIAGNGTAGSTGDTGPATSAELKTPGGIAVDSAGNLYIADTGNFKVRMVSGGVITTIAGTGTAGSTGDGNQAISATLADPLGVAVDASGNLYIADGTGHRVRKITGGVITTFAGTNAAVPVADGQPATNTGIGGANAVAVDNSGNVYVADTPDGEVDLITPSGLAYIVAGFRYLPVGSVHFAGDGGPALNAAFTFVNGVAVDPAGNLYISDGGNFRIRKVTGGFGGAISTFAGSGNMPYSGDGGPAALAQIGSGGMMVFDASGNLYVSDPFGNIVRRFGTNGIVSTVAGNGVQGYSGDGGAATSAALNYPHGLAFDTTGNLYIADTYNYCVRQVTPTGKISTFAGACTVAGAGGDGGPAASAYMTIPFGLTFDPAGNLYVADENNNSVRRIATNGIISTFAGNGTAGSTGDNGPAISAELNQPYVLASDAQGNIYVGEEAGFRIRRIAVNGTITTYAGTGTNASTGNNGPATSAAIGAPTGMAMDASGNLYIGDARFFLHRVSGGTMTEIAGTGIAGYTGDGGPATSATLEAIGGVVVDTQGNVYVGDGAAGRSIRVLRPAGTQPVLTIAASPTGSFSAGENGAAITLTVTNAAGSAATAGTVTVSAELPADYSLVSIAGNNWSCNGASCTRTDGLAPGASYDTLTVTFNISPTATTQDTAYFMVSGGSAAGAATYNTANIGVAAPVLTIGTYHQGVAAAGQNNLALTVVVGNAGTGTATNGTVLVTDTLPSGLTLVSAGGTGWICNGASCSRSDSLAGGGKYPPITFTVDVAAGASVPLANSVAVSVGGVSATATDTILAQGQLTVLAVSTSAIVAPGGFVAATVPAANLSGASTPGPVTFSAQFPSSFSPSVGLNTSLPFTCTGTSCSTTGPVPAGSGTLTFTVNNIVSSSETPGTNVQTSVTVSGPGLSTTTVNQSYTIEPTAAPTNSSSSTPTVISSLPYNTTENVSYAAQSSSIGCITGIAVQTVYFQYTATFTGTLSLNTFGSNYNTVIDVFNGSVATANSVGCAHAFATTSSDNSLIPAPSLLSIQVTSGTTYIIEVGCTSAGTINQLVLSVSNTEPIVLGVTQSHAGSFTGGQQGTYTINVIPYLNPTAGTITVTENLPPGLVLSSLTGAGWVCTGLTCMRSDTLTPGTSYPLTLVVNVGTGTSSPLTPSVTISGGGATTQIASDATTIIGGNSSLPSLTVGPNFGNFSPGPIQIPLAASGGSGTGYTYSITSGTLPAGVTIRTDGVPSNFPAGTTAGIIGVATATVYSPPASFTITVTDSANNSVAVPCTMSIVPLAITDSNRFTDGTMGVAYSYTPTAAGNTGSVTWAAPNGGLPPGLSINSSGLISGTPTTMGNYGFNLSATDSTGTIDYFYNIQIWGVSFATPGDLGNVVQGASVNLALAGAGGTSPYTFSANGVPSGLSLSSSGALTGTLTGGDGTFRFPVTVTDHNSNTYSKTFTIEILGAVTLPSLSYPNPAEDLTLGEPRQYSFEVNGGQSPYTWSIASGSLPPGTRLLTTNLPNNAGPDDAVLEGAPTQLGTFTFTISVKDSSPTPITVSQPFSVNVRAMTNDYPSTPPTLGQAYSFYLDPVGGTAPYSWSLVSGSLPTGLTLNPSTGVIGGTPQADGNYTAFVNITDTSGISLNRYLGLNVGTTATPQIAFNGPYTLNDGVVNNAYNANLGACCVTGGVTISAAGALPTGLTLSASGQLSGTPTVAGTYTIEAIATNNGNANDTGVGFFTLNISALTPDTPAPAGVVGTAYSTSFSATGGTGTLTWTTAAGSQTPPGLTLAGNGTLSGTPTSAGFFSVYFTVTDGASHHFSGSVTISVYPAGSTSALAITVPSNFGSNWTQGEIQYALTATGGNGTYTWTLFSGKLPTGLSIRTDIPSFFPAGTAAGIIGLATTPGNYSFTLAVTSGGVTSYQYCTWRITPLTLKDGQLPQAFVGVAYSYTLTALNPQSASVTWTPNGSLPAGLSLSSGGVISGTPSQAGNSNISFNFTDGVDTDNRTLSISVSPIQILSTPAINLVSNGSINMTLQASGGAGGYTWTANGLPNGLNLSSGGALSGTISAPLGRNGFVVAVTDSSNVSYSEEFSIDVIASPAFYPSIALNNLVFNPITPLGQYASRTISVLNGGNAPFTWSVTGLPAGMSYRTYNQGARSDLVPDDVEIWGTPTALGNYTVQFTVTDANGYSATLFTPFTVTALTVDGADYLPNGTLNTAYSSKLRVLGGTPPYSVSEVNTIFNPLPDGLTLSNANFTVTGTPLENGNFFPEFQFTDSSGGTGTGSANNSFVLLSGFNVSGGGLTIGSYFNLGDAYTGSTYSNTLAACCASSYTWTVAGGALPSGLTLSSAGVLSGTATPTGVYTFLVKVAQPNSANVGYKQFVLTVTPLAITSNGVVLSGTIGLPNGTVNTAYSSQIQISESAATFTLGIENPLPPGLTLSSSGLISGTPTATGQFLFDVLITDGAGHSTVGYFDLFIYPSTGAPLGITTGANLGTVPLGEVQIPLSATGGANGGAGNPSYTWSVTSGSLPPGLSLRTDKPAPFPSTASAGIIGVVTKASTAAYSFTLTVTSGSQSVSQAFTLKVTGLTAMENSGYRLTDAFVGKAFSYQLSASGNAGNVTWSAPAGLPSGITLSSTGALAGTPGSAGSYAIGYTINDTVDSVTTSVQLNVNLIQISNLGNTPGMLPSATQGIAYSTTLSASGGTAPYTFTAGSLPAGLTLTSAGAISGTPAAGPGRYGFNITATDNATPGHSYVQNTSIVIIGVPATLIYLQPYGNFDDCSVGMTCSRGISNLSGGTPPFNYSVTGLPAGMNFRSGQGATPNSIVPGDLELWGAPTVAGAYTVQVTVTDAGGLQSTQSFPLRVSNLYVDPNDVLPNGTINTAYSKLLRVLGGTLGASGTYTAKLNEGVLPDGTKLNSMTVSGTPVENGAFSPQFLYTDSVTPPNTLHITNNFTIANVTGDSVTLNTYDYGDVGSINDIIGYFTVNTAMSFTLNASGGSSLTWSKSSGTLPTGVTLSSSGVLSGTPTAVGTYTFLVEAAPPGQGAQSGPGGYKQYTMVITPLNITTTSPLPNGNVNSAYSTTLASTGAGAASPAFSVVNEYLLPPGLSLTSAGVLSGTPTQPGQFIFYVQVADGSGNLFLKQFSISVYGVGQTQPLSLSLGPNLGPYSIGVRNIQLTATGGQAPLTYSFTPGSGTLPDYRIQNGGQLPQAFPTSVTGGLLGVLTAGTFPTSIRVTDVNGATLDHAINLTGTTLTILNASSPPAAAVSTAYSYTFTASGGTGTYAWSATGLPTGLSIGASGTVSGTPSASGSSTATIIVADSAQTSVSVTYTFTVNGFAITTAQVLPQGAIGTAYSQALSANCQGCTWSVTSGNLPAGLSLSSAGAIAGTPTTAAIATFLVQASTSGGSGTSSAVREFTLIVPYSTPQPLFITTNPNLYSITLGNSAATALNVQGGTPPYTWSLASGTLPPGMMLVTAGETYGLNYLPGFGYLAGKATQLGNYSFTLQVTDAAQNITSQTFTWNVTPLNFNMTTFPFNGTAGTYGALTPTPTLGTAYSQQILLLGGSGNYVSWSTPLATNLLPPGLSLNSTTGVVSGTPDSTGSYSTLVQVSDDANNTIQQFITFNVVSGSSSTVAIGLGPNLGSVAAGGTYVFNVNPSGGTAPYTITAVNSLPPGCALETGSALLGNASGSYDLVCAPLASGNFTFTLKATDSASNIGEKQMNVTFAPQFLFSDDVLADGAVGTPYSQLLVTYDNSGTIAWAVSPGSALPPGLTLNGATISGTPSTAGNYSFVLNETDSVSGATISYTFTVTIATITITNPAILPVQATYLMPFSYQFTTTGGGQNQTYSASGLPSGLSMSAAGLISGTPTQTGTFNVGVTVTDGSSTQFQRFALFVYYPELMSYSPASTRLADVRVGQQITIGLSPAGGVAPFTWAVASGSSLPAGLSLLTGPQLASNSLPGITILGGEVGAAGHYSFSLTVTDSTGATLTVPFSLNVSAISIEAGSLPNATPNTAYSRQLTAAGGTGSYTFTSSPVVVNPPILPPGITLSASGLISGTPTSTGSYKFNVTATDGASNTYTTTYTLIVVSTSGLDITTGAPIGLSAGVAFSTQLAISGSSTYTWSITSGAFPTGVSLSSTGLLSGVASTPGNYTFNAHAVDKSNSANTADRQYTLAISPIQLNRLGLPPVGAIGSAYSYQFPVAGGTAPYIFATTPAQPLPPGLTLSPSGLLSGTPVMGGEYTIYATVTDFAGNTGWAIAGPFAFVQPGQNVPMIAQNVITHDASYGVPYVLSSAASGTSIDSAWVAFGVAPISYAVAPGSNLPTGMSLVPASNGVPAFLGGIPVNTGVFTYSLIATDVNGQTATVQFTTTLGTIAVTPALAASGRVGAAYSMTITPSDGTMPITFSLAPGSDLPPGLSLTSLGVLSGTPTLAGTFNVIVHVTDSEHPPAVMTYRYQIVIDTPNGSVPGISLSDTNTIQLSYIRTTPAPAAYPISVAATSGSIPFSATIDGIPALSLSANTGTASTTVGLAINPSGLASGVYNGIFGVLAPNSNTYALGIPVVLTVTDPPVCSYSVVPAAGTVAAAGGTASFLVSTGPSCSWTATASDPSFITVNPASASGTGQATVQYTLPANTGSAARTASISVNGASYSITQFGSGCALSITPTTVSATYAGGIAAVNVQTTNSTCAWTASGLGASPASGTGNGAVKFIIPPNATTSPVVLNASVQLTGGGAPAMFTVNQNGSNCTVSLSASGAGMSYTGGEGQVNVSTPAGCSYSTVNGPAWLTVTSGASGSGPGPVALTYSVTPNSSTAPRNGSLTIGDQTFFVGQAPTPCAVTIDTSALASPFGVNPASVNLNLTTNGANCAWSATSPVSWANVIPPFGSGNGTVQVSVTNNTLSTSSRTANINIGGTSVTIVQGGTVCSYTLASQSASVPYTGGTGRVLVSAPTVCTWTAQPDPAASWLTLQNTAGGNTQGTNLGFVAAANQTSTQRSGTLTIAGIPFTVTQAPGPCSYVLSPSAGSSAQASGMAGSFSYATSSQGCSVTPVSNASWLTATATGGSNGTSGTVNFTAATNPNGSTRAGTVQIGASTYTVTQAGATCSYTLQTTGASFGEAGGTGTVVVTAIGGCTPQTGTSGDLEAAPAVQLGQITSNGNVYTLPYTVAPFISATPSVRTVQILFGTISAGSANFFEMKQTSY